MKYLKTGLFMSAAILGLSSCSEENPWLNATDEGGIRLQFTTSGSIKTTAEQTRAGQMQVEVPNADEFKIRLTKNDGSLDKIFNSVREFEAEESFPTGQYTIEVFHGTPGEEGFDKPYFSGTSTVNVRAKQAADVSVEARMANSRVAVTYTEEFMAEYANYSTTLSTTPSTPLQLSAQETRPVYVNSGTVEINVTLVNSENKSATVSLGSFVAEPTTHYNLQIGVEGGSQSNFLVLKVYADDSVENEFVSVVLDDEIFNQPAPEVRASGFEAGQTVEMIQGEVPEGDKLSFHVFTWSGMKSSVLTVKSDIYSPIWGNSIDLVTADATRQSQMTQAGLEAKGFFKDPGQMAVLNVTNMLAGLPVGEHTISLDATDKLDRHADAVSLSVNILPATLSVTVNPEDRPAFGASEVHLYVSTNSETERKKLSFKVSGADNEPNVAVKDEEVGVKLIDAGSGVHPVRTYLYTIPIPVTESDVVVVEVYKKDIEKAIESFRITKVMPQYSVQTDAFAKHVVLKILPENAEQLQTIVNALKVKVSDSEVAASNIRRDAENGYVTVVGLTPESTYSTLEVGIASTFQSVASFTTEAAADVPNGDFSATHETINISKINVGGLYTVKVSIFTRDYQNYSSIVRSEATGWSSINAKTCYDKSQNINSWFTVPSTFAENGAVTLRSVGYSHNGTTPAKTGGNMNTNYYCENTPADSELTKAAGELFLGSYSFDGTENRVDGITFNSRPMTLSFDYRYKPVNNEKGESYIKLLAADGSVLSQSEVALSESADMKTLTISIPNYAFGVKAATIILGFKSSTGSDIKLNIPTGDDLNEGIINFLTDRAIAANAYKAVATGSELTIDNVKLGYDYPGTQSSAKNSKKSNKIRK